MCLTMKVKQFFVILTIILCTKCQFNSNPPCLITINIKELLILEESLWRKINTTKLNEAPSEKRTLITQKIDLVQKFEKFGDILKSNWSNDLGFDLEVLQSIEKWRKVKEFLRSIDELYKSFRRLQRQHSSPETRISPRQVWITFAKTVLNYPTYSIRSILDKIGDYINGQLFLNIIKDLDSNSVCVSQQSANQLLYNLYNTIALMEMKGYAMLQFSYMFLEIYGKGTFSTEAQMAREKYINISIETAHAMGKAMEKASPYLWRCDPEQYQSGDTYLEITQLLQGYVQNEVDLNPDGTCRENCAYYQFAKSHSCHENQYCRKQRRCKGRIFNCQYVDSDMWICPANVSSERRYNYIEYESGRVLGHKQSCNATKVESWWRWLFWHCSYCMCLCDEEGIYSDRYISLRSAVSDVEKDKIVTGLRFVKKNRIIHLQVQQGTLSPHGVINASTIEWVPVDDMKVTDRFVCNRDYFTLNWKNKAIDLDDLHGKEGAILTGIRFKLIGSHLNLEIRVTPFNFENGTLVLEPQTASEWLDNTNTDYSDDQRTRISINKVDVPTKTTIPSQIKSTHNQFIEFTHTDYDKDAAQTTVPFIDSQNVVPILPMPASGAGIYFKSTGNYGGFIGLKLVTYDFSKHLNFSIDPVIAEEPEPNIN